MVVECLPAIILLGGLWFLPFSPRWLLEKGRDGEALGVMKKLTTVGDASDVAYRSQFDQMQKQIHYERETSLNSVFKILSTKSARKRLLLAVLVQVFTQLSGVNVINCESLFLRLYYKIAHTSQRLYVIYLGRT